MTLEDNIQTIKEEEEATKIDPNDKVFCVVNGNGYNIIKNALLAKGGWREIKKDVLWTYINGPHNVVNFIWKPINFNYAHYSSID